MALAGVKTGIDMGKANRNEIGCRHDLRRLHEKPHGKPHGFAIVASEVGAIVIASWAWTLIRDTGRVLLDAADHDLEAEVRHEVEAAGDAQIVDLHVWRLGPTAHGAIVSYVGAATPADVRARLQPVHELQYVTIEAHNQ